MPHEGVRGVPLRGKEVSELRKGEFRDWERWDGEVPLSKKWGPGILCVWGRGVMGWGDPAMAGKRVQGVPGVEELQSWGLGEAGMRVRRVPV